MCLRTRAAERARRVTGRTRARARPKEREPGPGASETDGKGKKKKRKKEKRSRRLFVVRYARRPLTASACAREKKSGTARRRRPGGAAARGVSGGGKGGSRLITPTVGITLHRSASTSSAAAAAADGGRKQTDGRTDGPRSTNAGCTRERHGSPGEARAVLCVGEKCAAKPRGRCYPVGRRCRGNRRHGGFLSHPPGYLLRRAHRHFPPTEY